jgi:hypothetical protein
LRVINNFSGDRKKFEKLEKMPEKSGVKERGRGAPRGAPGIEVIKGC